MSTSFSILHETPHWIAINKPAGTIVENNPFESPTIESLVFDYLKKTKTKPYLGIVHRLDRVTSGVLLLAKKKSALRNLNEQFANRSVRKTYLAAITNVPTNPKGVLKHWLIKDQKNKKAVIYDRPQSQGQEVQLKYQILERKGDFTLLEIQPLSGKFHQIRAQLGALGFPIVGDDKYGSDVLAKARKIALHAWKLQISDPQSREKIELKAPLPEEVYWAPFLRRY